MGLLEKLIANRADVNVADARGFTPLIITCYNGSTEAVKVLLKNKAKVLKKDKFGRDALMSASSGESENGRIPGQEWSSDQHERSS